MRAFWTASIFVSALLGGVGPAQAAAAVNADPVTVEAFYAPAAIEQVALSPSGRWLAMRAGVGAARVGLVVFDLSEWRAVARAAGYNDADVAEFHWVNDERLVYTLTDRERGGGDQLAHPGLFSVKRDGTGPRTLVKMQRLFVSASTRVGREPLEPNHVLLHIPGTAGI